MKAKRAWLVRERYYDGADDLKFEIVFSEPECWQYSEIIPIVYFELEQG